MPQDPRTAAQASATPALSFAFGPFGADRLFSDGDMQRLGDGCRIALGAPLMDFSSDAARAVLLETEILVTGWGCPPIDADALSAGLLRVNALDVVYHDGLHLSAPGHEPLPPARQLNDIAANVTETVVHACVPTINAFGGNSSAPNAVTARPARYFSEQISVPDLYSNALETEVTTLRANVRILLAQENRDGYQSVPIARLQKNATGAWTIDETYIPPLIAIAGSTPLDLMMRRLLDILLVKSQALAGSHRERGKSVWNTALPTFRRSGCCIPSIARFRF